MRPERPDESLSSEEAARMLGAVCREIGASPSTCWLVPGLFLAQIEKDERAKEADRG